MVVEKVGTCGPAATDITPHTAAAAQPEALIGRGPTQRLQQASSGARADPRRPMRNRFATGRAPARLPEPPWPLDTRGKPPGDRRDATRARSTRCTPTARTGTEPAPVRRRLRLGHSDAAPPRLLP